MTYTPGPWIAHIRPDHRYFPHVHLGNPNHTIDDEMNKKLDGIQSDREAITINGTENIVTMAVCEANARLIASAPDLLEVCQDLLGLIYEHGTPIMKSHATRLLKARAVIAKAKGINEDPLPDCSQF